jgi:hypothetical protein
MSLEDIYADLYAIAGHRGPLDEDAVRSATTILARSRYTDSPTPAAQLVKDLENVIESIPNDVAGDDEEDQKGSAPPAYASRYFRSHARRYFSLDGSGEVLSRRRAFGRKNVNGTVLTWTNRGVIYRVAAGLLELWAKIDGSDAAGSKASYGLSYRIDSVKAIRYLERAWDYPTRDVLEYDLCILASGPHLLVLPLPALFTTLSVVSTERAAGNPKPQLIAVAGEDQSLAAVVFGAQQRPGERVRIQVEHMPRGIQFRRRRNHAWSRYPVDQPVGTLVLEVNPRGPSGDYKWQVSAHGPITSEAKIIEDPSNRIWSCENPDVGSRYQLYGTPQKKAERKRER